MTLGNLWIEETYINQTKGYQFGSTGVYETWTDDKGKLFRSLQKEYGRCVSRVYRDTDEGTKSIGWVFEKRMEYDDGPYPRYDDYGNRVKPDTYVREVWVTLHQAPPTKTIEYHYVEEAA